LKKSKGRELGRSSCKLMDNINNNILETDCENVEWIKLLKIAGCFEHDEILGSIE
jgi:hypothetical protein